MTREELRAWDLYAAGALSSIVYAAQLDDRPEAMVEGAEVAAEAADLMLAERRKRMTALNPCTGCAGELLPAEEVRRG